MSETLQPVRHPDADQLTAFMEQALPAHEREATLAHLAVCGECRSVVALALPPFEEAEAPLEQVAGPRRWFAGWRLGWVSVPALAAVVVVLLVARAHRNPASHTVAGPGSEVAESRSPAGLTGPSGQTPKQGIRKPSAAIPADRVGGTSTGRSYSAASTLDTAGAAIRDSPAKNDLKKLAVEGREVSAPTTLNQTPVKQPPTGSLAGSASATTAGAMGMGMANGYGIGAGQGGGAGAAKPASSTTVQSQQTTVAASVQSEGANATDPNAGLGMLARPAPQMLAQRAPATLAQPAPLTLAQRAPAARNMNAAVGGMLLEAALPSGLAAVSMVSSAQKRLAIDAHHALFESTDSGAHWSAVSTPWQGHAIRVGLVGSEMSRPRGLGFLASAPAPASGAGASIAGTVTDASGAAIPGATIVVTGLHGAIVRALMTDAAGRYAAGGVAPGNYQVEARAPGFAVQSSAAEVAASQPLIVNLKLSVSAEAQTVSVQASGGAIAASGARPAPYLSKGFAGGAKSKAPAAVPVFKITTDAGERWTSVDGLSWKHE